MSWFNKKMNNEKDFANEEEFIEGEEIPVSDKRRVNQDGDRINVEVHDHSENEKSAEQPPENAKSAEVVKLENALREMSMRADAAENKLQEVQKRFEEERTKMEQETLEMRGRMKKSLEQQADQGRFNFLTNLLPVLDNLNLAIQAAEENHSFENLIGGVKGTARSFEQALLNVGVQPIQAVGETFDPQLHEAVDIIETDQENDGRVTMEYARGYTFGEKLLRPARVQVGTAARSQANAE